MNFAAKFNAALAYRDFLAKYGTDSQRQRWEDVRKLVTLTPAQQQLLAGFRRRMKVLCMAGAWCGDCAEQCPVLDCLAEASPQIELRLIDRDADPELKDELTICGGARVPQVIFLSEDDTSLGRYGDRTLAKYRQLADQLGGAACSTGLLAEQDRSLLDAVTQEWLDQFERNQLILRLSPRLREIHGD